jgi:hypothetical protein
MDRECPQESREAVSTLIFAAARFPDLPELCDLRHIFTGTYGSLSCEVREMPHKFIICIIVVLLNLINNPCACSLFGNFAPIYSQMRRSFK